MRNKIYTVAVLATMTVGALLMTGCGEPRQKETAVTVEAGTELELDVNDYFNTTDEKKAKITFDTSKVDTDHVGEYEVTATYKKESYTITVTVEDTKAPQVMFNQRYVITNDIENFDLNTIIDEVKDNTDTTVEFAGFEKMELPIAEMNDDAIKSLTDKIVIPCDQNELSGITNVDVTDEGIYRGVIKVTDEGKNTDYEEIVVIYDTTAPLITDVETQTIEQDDVTVAPEVDLTQYEVVDNFDGTLTSDVYKAEMNLTNEETHEYTVTVSAVDRAGNEVSKDFLVDVVEKKEEVADTTSNSGKGGSSSKGNGSSSGSGSSNSGSGNSGSGSSSSNTINDAGDWSNDALAQNAANIGLYNVQYDSDSCYVLVNVGEYDRGVELVRNYLSSLGLTYQAIYGNNYGETGFFSVYVPCSQIVTIESVNPPIVEEEIIPIQ